MPWKCFPHAPLKDFYQRIELYADAAAQILRRRFLFLTLFRSDFNCKNPFDCKEN